MNAAVLSSVVQYDALRESLTRAGFILALPELHGAISGVLCGGGERAIQRWLDECLAEHAGRAHASEIAPTLEELALVTGETLASVDLRFEPLLPDEDAALDEQVRALASWCHGFLTGLAFGSARPKDLQEGELREILEDFAEISRAGLTPEDSEDRDQADFALAEIKEYVRVSVQVVFEELRSKP
ncbi:MAG TPA: UPF0149 family protein [Gammaproteobacteria bacterium]|nr:UPF0149 family protein [Gammaproteobacteria bacterium]